MASKNLARPELVFDMDDMPMLFKPEYEDEYVQMAYEPASETVGTYIPVWYGECCSDLHDPPEVPEPPKPLFPRLTGSQLRWLRGRLPAV